MNWENCAISDLKKYSAMKESLRNIPERLEILEIKFKSVKSGSSDSTPVQGGGSRIEEAILDNIAERERLQLLYNANARLVKLMQRGLNALTKEERLTLQLFYIDRPQNHIGELCTRLGCEQAQVYRIKKDALYKFTITMYGISEY